MQVIVIESPSTNMIALNPQWLGTDIIGRMFSGEALHSARITGSYTVDDLQLSVRVVNTANLVLLLEALGLAVCCVVRDEPVVEQRKRRSRKCQTSSENDFFDLASQQTLGGPQTPATKRHVSVYLAAEWANNPDALNQDDIQLEAPRYNRISMSIPPWEPITDADSMRYLGFQISTERSQMMHLISRIQVHLRITAEEIFARNRSIRGGDESKSCFTRWEMSQMKNAFHITMYEGAIEIAATLSEDNQVSM